ncbi:MAG: hypothetical protein PUA69_06940 [Erysipelotrichaceae bacterium]|nr:hypothetical protein [Erysipelotrichaceae bacterium]
MKRPYKKICIVLIALYLLANFSLIINTAIIKTTDKWLSNRWEYIDGSWYYFDESGNMSYGWKEINNKTFYLNSDGKMITGWKDIDNNWYYFNDDGTLVTDKVIDNQYYVDTSGVMVTNEWIGRSYYDSNGHYDSYASEHASNNFFEPTYFNKINNTYFVVDSQNCRILYSNNYSLPVKNWKLLDDDLYYPHSIDGNNNTIVADDTINCRLKVYKRNNNEWKLSQILKTPEDHPHFTYYDKTRDCWYVLGSSKDVIYILRENGKNIEITSEKSIPEIGGYSRSFSIIDGYMYIVSELPGKYILKVDYLNDWKVTGQYPVAYAICGMNGLIKSGDYWYASVYRDESGIIDPHLLKFKKLSDLQDVNLTEDLYDSLSLNGIPYFFSTFDSNIYLTTIEDLSSNGKYFQNSISLLNFDDAGNLINQQYIYYKDGHS